MDLEGSRDLTDKSIFTTGRVSKRVENSIKGLSWMPKEGD
jgi:hypothetical protein